MTRDDWPQLKEVVGAIYAFYRRDLTTMTLRMWFEALKAYEITTVQAAFSRHLINPDNGQFLPMPADLVKLIEGGSDDAALVAWAKVDRAVRTVGPYQSVVFDDPLIHYVIVNMGGWIGLGDKGEDEWPFERNRFVALYRGARMRAFEHPRRLVGKAEADRRAVEPVLIGNRELALVVMNGGVDAVHHEARPVHALLPAALKQEASA